MSRWMISDRRWGGRCGVPGPYRPTGLPPTLAAVNIYTKTGDEGQTSLFGGGRVFKNDPRVAAYGNIDELNCVIGLVIATEPHDLESDLLVSIQRDLFSIGGRLASPAPEKVASALEKTAIPETRITEIEAAIDRVVAQLPELTAFILPGGSTKSAQLHHARSVCRRAERGVVELARQQDVPPLALVFLNRLSDLLFVLARLANHRANIADTKW